MKLNRFILLALFLAVQVISQVSIKEVYRYITDDPKGLDDVPVVFRVSQNYPNPYNPETNIKFELLKDADFNFIVHNVTGNQIYSISASKPAGTYQITFNGSGLSSGIYFYSVQSAGYMVTKKMILIK